MFPTTIWHWISEAGQAHSDGFQQAIAEVCRTYWYPIYCFIRSRRHDPDEAMDLTQDYLTRLLEGRLLTAADPCRGRFRALLITDCLHFLADQHDFRRAQKRGGGRRVISLDAVDATRRYRLEPHSCLDPETLFDRTWALEILKRALERLERDEIEAGRAANFAEMRRFLVAGATLPTYAELADRLQMSVRAIEGALRRLRKRYAQALRATVAETLKEPTETNIQEELGLLFLALGRDAAWDGSTDAVKQD